MPVTQADFLEATSNVNRSVGSGSPFADFFGGEHRLVDEHCCHG